MIEGYDWLRSRLLVRPMYFSVANKMFSSYLLNVFLFFFSLI